MSGYFDNSNGQPTITHGGPGGLGGSGAQSIFDATNSSGNQLVYVPDPAWIGGNYPMYGWMFNWTATGLEIECEATTPVNQQGNVPAGGWVSGGSTVINPIPCQEGDSISLYDASGSLACQFTVPTFNKAVTFGQVGHVLTNTGNAANVTSSTWECISIANNEYLYRHGTITAYDFKYDVTNDQWLDANTVAGNWPSHFGTSTTDGTAITPTIADQYLYLWDSNNFICEIENDGYTTSSGSGSGTTQTYTRTANPGPFPSATNYTIRPPLGEVVYNPNYHAIGDLPWFRKIGVKKFKLKWYDQQEPASGYTAYCEYTNQLGNQETVSLAVTVGTGDVNWEIDTIAGSNSAIAHNSVVKLSFSSNVTYQGNTVTAGSVFKQWTYLAVGPYSGFMSPKRARPGENITIGFKDENPYPDAGVCGSYELPDGTSGNLCPNVTPGGASSANPNPHTAVVPAQEGWHKLYYASISHRTIGHLLFKQLFKKRGKVSSNFW